MTDLIKRLREGEAVCKTVGLEHASIYGEAARRIEALEISLSAVTGILEATFPSMASPSIRDTVKAARTLLENPKK